MKIEIDGGAVPVVIICAFALVLTILGVCAMLMDCYEVRTYTAHGYTRTTLPGANCAYWVKETK